jgi:hypothetical protein
MATNYYAPVTSPEEEEEERRRRTTEGDYPAPAPVAAPPSAAPSVAAPASLAASPFDSLAVPSAAAPPVTPMHMPAAGGQVLSSLALTSPAMPMRAQPLGAVSPSSTEGYSAAEPYSHGPGSTSDLEARAGQPRSYAPAMPGAPAPGSTEDLEARGAQSHTYAPATPPLSPAEMRLKNLTDAGAPPVQPLHGAKRVFDTLGQIFVPDVEQRIRYAPQRAYQRNLSQAEADVTGEQFPQAEASKTGLQTAQANEANARATALTNPPPEYKNIPGLEGPNGEPVHINEKTGKYEYGQLPGVKQTKQSGETQEQNKLGFQGVVGKLDAAHLPTDVKSIDKSLDAALKQGVITPQEHAAARSYQAANPTPGTNLTVHVAGQEEGNRLAIDKMFEGKEVLAHMPDGRRVQMSYADAKAQGVPPERLVALNAKEAQETRDKAASVETTFKGLDRYRTDYKMTAPQLTGKDRDALRVLASHNESGATGGLIAGFIDELPLAGPLSSYVNKLAEGTMTSDQYKQLSPAGKKLVSDYFTSIIDNFANMKAVMGTVGRNPQMLQAEVNTIPVPYLDWESAQIQFENKRASLQGRATSLPELYAPKTQ